MTGLRPNRLPVLLALAACAVLAAPAWACPFCGMQGQTLTQEVNQASLVLYGRLVNGKPGNPTDELGGGTTDMIIEQVIKPHPILDKLARASKRAKGKKEITLPRYVPTTDGDPVHYLIFCDVYKERIDPYRGTPVKGSDMPKYLAGALRVKDRKVSEKLRFFFDYLNNEDLEIANDALKEFGNSDYKDYQDMAGDLPAEKVAKWLKDPKTPAYRFGLYASILGHCGKKNAAEYAKLLRSFVEDPDKKVSSGVDGILAGYVMLQPREGWEYVRGILKNPKNEFLLRYAALRAVRFFVDYRPDIISKEKSVEAVSLLLNQPDIADLAVEDLRKWKRWEKTQEILALREKESHDVPIIRRAVLRFALSSPSKEASAYVKAERRRDEQAVADAEELLKLEQQPPVPPAPQTSSK